MTNSDTRWVDREGIFRAECVETTVYEPKAGSQAVMVGMVFRITAKLEGNEWQDWSEYDVYASGSLCIVKRDGSMNEKMVEAIAEAMGWRADFTEFGTRTDWFPCQINVKADEYKGTTRFKVSWLNPIDFAPESRTAGEDALAAMNARYGSQVRALCKTQAPAAPAESKTPDSSAQASPPPPPLPASAPQPPAAGVSVDEEDIPF